MSNWSGWDWFVVAMITVVLVVIAHYIFEWFIGVSEINEKLDQIIKLLVKKGGDDHV